MKFNKPLVNRYLHKSTSKLSMVIKPLSAYLLISLSLSSTMQPALAATTHHNKKFKTTLNIDIYDTNKKHKFLGTVKAFNSTHGLTLKTNLTGLTPGEHGFHLHKYATCANHGLAAGSHWDPQHTNHHSGPYKNNGHLGDLPRLIANKHGQASETIYAPRLKLKDLAGHSLVIHAGGDNYSDKPAKNGGGGKRIACGIIRKNILKN